MIPPTEKQINRPPYQTAELLCKLASTQEKSIISDALTVKQSTKYHKQPELCGITETKFSRELP